MPAWAGAAEWPLVGRVEELALIRQLRGSGTSSVISGPAGVGKSRLASAALVEAASEGWATLTVRGSAGLGGVPLGPLRTVLGVASSTDLAHLTALIERELVGMRSGAGLLVLAEDGQDLDDTSAALLHQLVGAGAILTLVTMRSGTRHPDSLTALWRDGLAGRIELQDLSRHDTLALLGAAAGDSSAERIWQLTGGNPLYIREVALASVETGALKEVDGGWRWRGEWATDARLQELVASRLGRLDPDELTAMEMLAVAGSLPLAFVTGLTSARAVEVLEERGLVTLLHLGRRLEVTVAHEVHAEVMRSGIPSLRMRAIRRNLVEALSRSEYRRAADNVRLACWSVEAGIDVDLVTLVRGADASLFQIGQAICAKLDEILPDASRPRRLPAVPVVPRDDALAVRLAQAAYERTGAIPEGAALASVLAWTGATAKAEAVLADLTGRAVEIDDRLRLALALGWVRFWGRFDVDGAVAVLVETAEAAGAEGDRALLSDVYQHLAGIELNTAHPAAALAHAQRAGAIMGVDVGDSIAASPAAASLAYLGRCEEAIALADHAIQATLNRGDEGLAVPSLLFARAGGLSRLGRLEEAQVLAESCRQVALSSGSMDGTAMFGVLAGEILLRQGRPGSAGRMFRDAAGLFVERDILGYRPWALAGLARARAQTGDEAGAEGALAEARRVAGVFRHFEMSRFLAEVAVHTVAGRPAAALDAARDGAAWARDAGMVVDEALALHAWVLAEPSSAAADRMTELTARTDSDLVAALAAHASALASADPAGLVAAGDRLAAMSAWWMATEAAAAAVRLFERRHQRRAGEAAARSARAFAAHCEGSRSALVDSLDAPSGLTTREHEVARLVAAGYSSQEIAERLFLSRRTVESHLYHAYVKLGVSGRADLSAALGAGSPDQ